MKSPHSPRSFRAAGHFQVVLSQLLFQTVEAPHYSADVCLDELIGNRFILMVGRATHSRVVIPNTYRVLCSLHMPDQLGRQSPYLQRLACNVIYIENCIYWRIFSFFRKMEKGLPASLLAALPQNLKGRLRSVVAIGFEFLDFSFLDAKSFYRDLKRKVPCIDGGGSADQRTKKAEPFSRRDVYPNDQHTCDEPPQEPRGDADCCVNDNWPFHHSTVVWPVSIVERAAA